RETPGGRLRPTVGIDKARPESGEAGVRVEVRDHPLQAPVLTRRVLVEHEHVTAGRRPDDRVVIRAEACPMALLDHATLPQALPTGRGRTVLRSVVEDVDLDGLALERLEAGEEELAGVRVDERDQDVRHYGVCVRPGAHEGGRFRSTSTLSKRTGSWTPISRAQSAIRRKPSSSGTVGSSPKTRCS